MNMTNDSTEIRAMIALYGSDTRLWPREARELAKTASSKPEFAALFEQEKRFEQLLRSRREPAITGDLCDRIIFASLARAPIPAIAGWMMELRNRFNRTAIAAMLALGFAIGFGILAQPPSPAPGVSHSYTYEEGAIL
ncbi:MAG: hypothetical protein HY221_02135 [Candidatus Sungbacteria bacterium]|uniref:Uncharacterized protein n=1 Tax=Candidatus Sungiibacteriota bacterium TaxID=2750080 RepID=A0A932QYG1_9BACT|nr:hypothetical protein [Candidatus Sungbacteria bacterium]